MEEGEINHQQPQVQEQDQTVDKEIEEEGEINHQQPQVQEQDQTVDKEIEEEGEINHQQPQVQEQDQTVDKEIEEEGEINHQQPQVQEQDQTFDKEIEEEREINHQQPQVQEQDQTFDKEIEEAEINTNHEVEKDPLLEGLSEPQNPENQGDEVNKLSIVSIKQYDLLISRESQTDNISSSQPEKQISQKNHHHDVQITKGLGNNRQQYPNWKFLVNKGKTCKEWYIVELFKKKWGDYRWLEDDHDYIQWLFPNKFKSRFNPDSYALQDGEAQHIINDDEVGYFFKHKAIMYYRDGFRMFMDFLGFIVKPDIIEMVNGQRFYTAMYRNIHNRDRVIRVFASLTEMKQIHWLELLKDTIHRHSPGFSVLIYLELYSDLTRYL